MSDQRVRLRRGGGVIAEAHDQRATQLYTARDARSDRQGRL